MLRRKSNVGKRMWFAKGGEVVSGIFHRVTWELVFWICEVWAFQERNQSMQRSWDRIQLARSTREPRAQCGWNRGSSKAKQSLGGQVREAGGEGKMPEESLANACKTFREDAPGWINGVYSCIKVHGNLLQHYICNLFNAHFYKRGLHCTRQYTLKVSALLMWLKLRVTSVMGNALNSLSYRFMELGLVHAMKDNTQCD